MYELIQNAGVESLNELHVLEYVLTIIIPRKNTNPIAHKLLNEFGSFSNVLDADIESLKKTEGIGERAAILLNSLPNIFQYYKENKIGKKIKINNYRDVERYYTVLLGSKPCEEIFVTALNSNCEVVISKRLSKGSSSTVEITSRDISEFVIKFSPSSVIIGHCHPDADPTPSYEDIKSTKLIKKILNMLDVSLVDHIIIGKNSSFSFFKNNLLEKL